MMKVSAGRVRLNPIKLGKNAKIKLLGSFSAILLCMLSCNEDVIKSPQNPNMDLNRQVDTFSLLMQEVFGPSCASCHNPSKGISLTSYDAITRGTVRGAPLVVAGDAENSPLYRVIADGIMPPRGEVKAQHMRLLAHWINEGAGRNVPLPSDVGTGSETDDAEPEKTPTDEDSEPVVTPTPTPDPDIGRDPNNPSLTFAMISDAILTPSCVKCHNANNAKAGVALDAYESLMATDGLVVAGYPQESLLYLVVADGFMPMRADPLPQELQDMLSQWIAEGAHYE